jgi:putative phosphoesterase
MKIGLISDTHFPALGPHLAPEIAMAFADVDLILHAGDIYNSACLDELEALAPVIAVEVPLAPVTGDHRVVDDRRVVHVEGHAIGLVHDLAIPRVTEVTPGALARGYPEDDGRVAPALEAIFGEPVDIVVFGDSHRAVAETCQGILFVNPGSPTLPNQIKRLGDVAVLEIGPDGCEATIVDLRTLRPSAPSPAPAADSSA